PRRRPDLPVDDRGLAHAGDPVRRRRSRAGIRARPDARAADRRALRRARGTARRRPPRDEPRPDLMEDRRLLEGHEEGPDELRRHTALIADEFYEGFIAVERIDRPAVSIFGSARVHEDSP